MANAEKKEYKLNIKLVGDGSVKKNKVWEKHFIEDLNVTGKQFGKPECVSLLIRMIP